jgi:hypothetical protein
MKSKHWDVKSPVIYKDTLGIPYSLEEVVVKMKYHSFFSEFFGPITNDLVKDLVDKGRLKATKNGENYNITQNDYADFYDEVKKEHDSREQKKEE